VLALETIRIILDEQGNYPLGADAVNSLDFVYDMNANAYSSDFDNWLLSGAVFSSMNPNIVDGLWLYYRDMGGKPFAEKFFMPQQPAYIGEITPILDSVNSYGSDASHTLFAALVSAAHGTDLSATFAGDYNYPIIQSFFDYTYEILLPIMYPYICGDADGSGAVDIDDVVYLIAYIFSGGPAPEPLATGDADCSGAIDIDDVVYLIAYIFAGGPAPCDPSGDGVPDC
jgi:hypothetical protein